MVKSKLIKYSEHEYNLRLYCLPTTKLLKGNLAHELLCGDLYVAFQPDYWKCPSETDAYGLKPDRIMIHFGKLVFWEVDRNTEDYTKIIREKLEKYVKLSAENPTKRFHVIFTTVDTKRQKAESRCAGLLNMFVAYKCGNQFLTTKHEWACKFPDGAAFLSPLSPMGCAIAEAK
jgi:hypothetical protein